MKSFYEAPVAEVIDFTAREALAVIEETMGKDPEASVGSKDF